jgi:hypothetical protein
MFNLIQATALKQPFVRRILNIPNAPVIEAPPGPPIDTNPGFKDTWRSLVDFQKEQMNKAADLQARSQANKAAVERERVKQASAGTGAMYEKVQETRQPASGSSDEPAAPAAPISRDEAKRRRVAAARAKRGQQ